jgi:hypothetical protein
VAVLDGAEESVALDLPQVRRSKSRTTSAPKMACDDIPAELLDMAAEDAGRGVVTLDTSDKAWAAIRRAFADLRGCSTGRRHRTLNKIAWELARLVDEDELPMEVAREGFLEAASGINNSDGRYDAALIQRHIDDAFDDVCGRQ